VKIRIPYLDVSMLVRTYFEAGSTPRWHEIQDACLAPNPDPISGDHYSANFEIVDHLENEGATPEDLMAALPDAPPPRYLFIADETTFLDPETPVLVLDLRDQPGQRFRVIPRVIWAVENNLSIRNTQFQAYLDMLADSGVSDGVLRNTGATTSPPTDPS